MAKRRSGASWSGGAGASRSRRWASRVTDQGWRARTVYPLAEDASRELDVRWEVRDGRWRWSASRWPSRD